jgi:hypothetical protein
MRALCLLRPNDGLLITNQLLSELPALLDECSVFIATAGKPERETMLGLGFGMRRRFHKQSEI